MSHVRTLIFLLTSCCWSALVALAQPLITNAGAAAVPEGNWHQVTPPGEVWVKPGGSDHSGCGTAAAPCKSITYAIGRAKAGAGSVIKVEGGTAAYGGVDIYDSGTETRPYVIQGVPDSAGNRPLVLPGNSGTTPPFRVFGDYWIIRGLNLRCDDRKMTGVYLLPGATHIAVRDLDVSKCAKGAVHLRGAEDVYVQDNVLHDNVGIRDDGRRDDANGLTIEHGSARVYVSGNRMFRNSGDGIQIQGREQEADTNNTAYDCRDVTIVSNFMHDNMEDAVDIKSAYRITVGPGNTMWNHNAADDTGDCGGSNMVLHFHARQILIQQNSMHSAGGGIGIGGNSYLTHLVPDGVVVRRNLIYRMNNNSVTTFPNGIVKRNCGDGIRINKAQGQGVELYHNDIEQVARIGFGVGIAAEHSFAAPIRFWNNLVTNAATTTVDVQPARISPAQLYLDHNHYFRSGGPALFRWGSAGSLNLASWKSQSGKDAASTEGDPLYTSPATTPPDFKLRAGSPALNTARVDAGNAGTNQRCAGLPDRGAIESDCGSSTGGSNGQQGPALWSFVEGSGAADVYLDVKADANGYIYAAGWSEGSFAYTGQGGKDAIVTRLSSSGTRLWSRQLGSAANEEAIGVAIGPSGSVAITGRTDGALYSGHKGGWDVFVSLYDSAGTRLFIAPQLGSAAADEGRAAVIDPSGYIYIAGVTWGALGSASLGGSDAFVAKYSLSTGALLWVRQFGTSADDFASGIALDQSGNVYVAGTTQGNLAGANAGGGDIYVARFDASGNRVWTVQRGSAALDVATGIASDAAGNLTISGYTAGPFAYTFQGGAYDAIIARFTSSGALVWARQLGSAADERATAIGIGASGEAWITGWVTGPLYTRHYGSSDVFVARYLSDGSRTALHQQGSADTDTGEGVGVAPDGVYVCGSTGSSPVSSANQTACYKFSH